MSQAIEIQISGDALAAVSRLRDLPGLGVAIARTMDRENEFTIAHIQQFKLSQRGPDTLGVRTGRLRRSIRRTNAMVTGTGVESAIGTNVVYAGIHEFGGTTKPHIIKAKPGKMLAFSAGGKKLFRKSVKHPGSRIPARAPIGTGIRERSGKYGAAISATILNFWEANK